MPTSFSNIFPAERDGAPATYKLAEIHTALLAAGYDWVTMGQVADARRTLAERGGACQVQVTPIKVPHQRAHEFTPAAACAIARQVVRGRQSNRQKVEAQARHRLVNAAAGQDYELQRDLELLRTGRSMEILLRHIARKIGALPNADGAAGEAGKK